MGEDMTATVRELAERLGPVHDVVQSNSGSREIVTLRPLRSDGYVIATKATLALARCGVSLLAAKRAIKRVIDEGEETLILPMVSAQHDLSKTLAAAGIDVVYDSGVGSCQR